MELSRDVKPVEDIDGASQNSGAPQFMSDPAYMPEEHPEKSNDSSRPLRFVD